MEGLKSSPFYIVFFYQKPLFCFVSGWSLHIVSFSFLKGNKISMLWFVFNFIKELLIIIVCNKSVHCVCHTLSLQGRSQQNCSNLIAGCGDCFPIVADFFSGILVGVANCMVLIVNCFNQCFQESIAWSFFKVDMIILTSLVYFHLFSLTRRKEWGTSSLFYYLFTFPD